MSSRTAALTKSVSAGAFCTLNEHLLQLTECINSSWRGSIQDSLGRLSEGWNIIFFGLGKEIIVLETAFSLWGEGTFRAGIGSSPSFLQASTARALCASAKGREVCDTGTRKGAHASSSRMRFFKTSTSEERWT